MAAAMPAGIIFFKYFFYLALEIQLLCGCRIVIRVLIDFHMIQKQGKPLHENLKQRNVKGLKLKNLRSAKNGIKERGFAFKMSR